MKLRQVQTVKSFQSFGDGIVRLTMTAALALLSTVATAQNTSSQSSNDAMSLLLDQNRQLRAD